MAFGYGGPSVAAALTVGVLNDAIAIAQAKTDGVDTYLGNALTLAANTPQVNPAIVDGSFTLPNPPSLAFDPNQLQALYNDTANQLRDQLATDFTFYLNTYFPLGSELESAISWVRRALTTGGSGINTTVEAQIWDRDRSRILSDATRAEDEAAASWAAKGYPVPPGALAYQVLQVRHEAHKSIAESSRNTAIKVFDTEVENARIAVGRAIELRTSAISSALDYLRAKALGPQLGAQLATALVDAEAKIAAAMTDFYRAQVVAAEIPVRIATSNAEFTQRSRESNQRANLDTIKQRVDVTLAAAQALATQAAAMLNGFHASVGVSGQESL